MPKEFNDFLERYELRWVVGLAVAIMAVAFGFWINQPDASVQVIIVSAGATAMIAWFAIVATWHARRQVDISKEALKVAEKQAEISSRVGLTTARLNALSALADYYRDHANSGYQSKEATESAEEMRKILEEVRSGDFVDISRVK